MPLPTIHAFMSRSLALAATTLTLLVSLAASPSPASAAVCADHPNQRSAQQAKDTRDADGDGIYCEALPCPCSKPGQSTAPKPKPRPAPRRSTVKARPKPKAKPKPKAGPPMVFENVEVAEAIDGDTISVFLPGRDVTTNVRLVGIQAPDGGPRRNGIQECGGLQATAATQALAARWARVTLRVDNKHYRYDRHGQLLAYVEPKANPTTTYQQQLLSQGWATVDAAGGLQREGRFDEAQGQAELDNLGAWSQCGADFHTPLTPLPPPAISSRAGDRTIVVTSDGVIRAGSWKPDRDGFELRSLARVWGPPTTYIDCIATWDDLGVSVGTTYTPGNCKRSSSRGHVKVVTADGPGWRTNRGLEIGDNVVQIDALYPTPFDEPFENIDDGTTYIPLSGFFLEGAGGARKDELVAVTDEEDTVSSLSATLIFGAG